MTHHEHDSQSEIEIKRIVEKYGWYVALFEADTATPSFAFTIGLWKNFKHPEIISFGLPVNTLGGILNNAVELIKKGQVIDLNKNNFSILNKLPVYFKQVNNDNIPDYFGYARWFYNYEDFPAIQLFWTDKNGKYLWDDGYDKNLEFKQPLLDKKLDFKFFEKRNVAVFSVKQIFQKHQPILYVSHDDEDDSWQFLTGDSVLESDVMIVALEQITKLDPTINELFNLPTGQIATRNFIGDNWIRHEVNSTIE